MFVKRTYQISTTGGWQPAIPTAYAYLLGVYLGDGHVTLKPPNTWTLRVSCDQRYPRVEAEIAEAMAAIFGNAMPRRYSPSNQAVDVLSLTHPTVRDAFPQHGPGPKHMRPIVLTGWQRRITSMHARELIRGLIHSDGCRTVNRFRTLLPSGRVGEYTYPRYFFSNRSADNREIFVEHCEVLGIRVTQSNERNLSVSHRKSVALLDEFVGIKT